MFGYLPGVVNKVISLVILLVYGFLWVGSATAFEDDNGCLLCHKYPKMGRVLDDGTRRSFYVMPEVFANTVHRNVLCKDCHNYINELPHKKVDEGVTCDSECHSVKNPATGKNFSHKSIYDTYKTSVHGREKIVDGIEGDKPYCVTCHQNPVYNPDENKPPTEVTDRCVVCHEDRSFVDSWYSHTSRRINKIQRSPQEITQLCSSCHQDEALIERHTLAAKEEGRELGKKFSLAAASYEESFHGKVSKYGLKKAASCLDCHASQKNYFMSVHEILPSRDPDSPVSKEHRLVTCQRCHVEAGKNYESIDPHPLPATLQEANQFRYMANKIYNIIGDSVIIFFIVLQVLETLARRRDGVCWRLVNGSSWRRKSKRGRDRLAATV